MLKNNNKYVQIAKVFSALANPVRLKILDELINNCSGSKDNGCCVGEINKNIDLPQPYISKHLKILKDNGILTYRRDTNKIIYSFAKKDILNEIFTYIKKYLECC